METYRLRGEIDAYDKLLTGAVHHVSPDPYPTSDAPLGYQPYVETTDMLDLQPRSEH